MITCAKCGFWIRNRKDCRSRDGLDYHAGCLAYIEAEQWAAALEKLRAVRVQDLPANLRAVLTSSRKGSRQWRRHHAEQIRTLRSLGFWPKVVRLTGARRGEWRTSSRAS